MKLNIPDAPYPRVVIVGGGFGGIRLAKKLAKREFQVVLLDKHNYHTFQPLLYQVATGGLEPDSIAYPLRKIFKSERGIYFRVAEVLNINAEQKRLETNVGPLRYDFLVIATGSTTNFFGNKAIATNAMSMKSVPEALDLRSLLLQNFEHALQTEDKDEQVAYLTVVIVGGGPTGVEIAGALAELKKHVLPNDYKELNIDLMNVILVESNSRVLAVMDERNSEKALHFLKKLGVVVKTSSQVKDYDGKTAHFSNGEKINCRTLIWSAGVMGATIPGLEASLTEKGNRYLVDDHNQLKNYKNIFAIGDVAAMITERNPQPHPMLAPVANQQADLLIENFDRLSKGKPLLPFTYFNKGTMATVGRNKAVVEVGKLRFQGLLAWLVWMFLHLMLLVGFRNRVIVFINWSWNYFSYDRGIRLIIRPFKGKNIES